MEKKKGSKIKPLDRKRESRREAIQGAQLSLDREKDRIHLKFWVEEHLDSKKPQLPPDVRDSELWMYSEAHPSGWPGRKQGRYFYVFTVEIPVEKDALSKHKWSGG